MVSGIVTRHCDELLRDEVFMAKVKSLNFKVALVDAFLINKCNLLLPYVHDIPFIHVSTITEPSLGKYM